MEAFSKIKQYAKRHSELQKYCSENIETILKHLPERLLKGDANLNELFTGLSDPKNLEHKIKVVDIVLMVLRKEIVPLTDCGNIISRVCLELPSIPSAAVVRWSNESVDSIRDNNDVNMIWRDVLPECLNTISSAEYRTKVLQQLLLCNWRVNQLVQLTAMFKDLRLSAQEHKEVVVKICSYMTNMPPTSLSPLVHQLLKLCKMNNVDVVLVHLSHYFNVRLYSMLSTFSRDSESTTMDIEDIVEFSEKELYDCLGTCMYHAIDAAEPEALRKQVNNWPRSSLAREPFIVIVALALMAKGGSFKTTCLDALRSAIDQVALDEMRLKESAWMRRVLPSPLDIDEMLKELVYGGCGSRSGDVRRSNIDFSCTWMGLIELCFVLLACARNVATHACAARGADTLARLALAQPGTADRIVDVLADRLAADVANIHYTECLSQLCEMAPESLRTCSKLVSIIENCHPSPGAHAVFAAVRPLLVVNERLRDVLVVVCRKGLYSRDSAHRCLAASGILTVLKMMPVGSASIANTQETEDDASQLSQSYMSVVAADVHATQVGASVSCRATQETICHEMLSILRRCLGQDAAVKQLLYTSWFSCVQNKPSLHHSLLDMLHEHLSQYLPDDGETTLLIDKCIQNTTTNPVLIEPIGYLLYLIAQLLKLPASPREDENSLRRKLNIIMTDLSQCDLLEQIDMENLKTWDSSAESRANVIKIQQLLQVYEALVAHQVLQWSPADGRAESVYSLYKGYTQLLNNTKSPTKLGKKAKKLNESTDSTKSRKSQQSSKSQRAAANGERQRKALQTLPCLWDLKLCHRILELLYSSEVPWSSAGQLKALRGRGVVHCWVAQSVTSALGRKLDDTLGPNTNHVRSLAALLYDRWLCRFQDFDPETIVGCLEMFATCLKLVFSPKYNVEVTMNLLKITGSKDGPGINKAKLLCTLRKALLIAEHWLSHEGSFVNRRIVKLVVDIIVTTLRIPTDSDISLSKEVHKMEEHVRETRHDCAALCAPLLAAAAAESCECALLDELLARLADVLAEQTTEDSQSTQESVPFPWLQTGVAGAVRAHIGTHLQSRVAWARRTIQRANDLAKALLVAVAPARPTIEIELKEVRSVCVLQLCQMARALHALCALGGEGAGGAATGEAALVWHLYRLAGALLQPMDATAAVDAGVVNLVKVMGDPLTRAVRSARARWSSKRVPRVVRFAEVFRSRVYLLDKKGQCGYKQYVSERIAMEGMRIQTEADGGGDEAVDVTREEPTDETRGSAVDVTMEEEDGAMSEDSDADTVIIESTTEHYRHL